MDRKPSVYVSSTFEDLQSERRRVLKVIERLEAVPRAMENYTARDENALSKCVEDVQDSSLYIGIIGWRQGFCPPQTPGVSITEAEFEAATAAKKVRLVYFASDAKRPANLSNDDPIVRLRERLSRSGILRAVFEDDADLASLVAIDLERELEKLRSARTPESLLLPYLCDREPQMRAIVDDMADAFAAPTTLCLLHGQGAECPAKFVECIRSVHLPELLGVARGTTREHALPWPDDAPERVPRRLRLELARSLGLDVRTATDELVQNQVVMYPGPVLISFQISARDFGTLDSKRLHALIDYFKAFPARQPRKPELIVLWLQYPSAKKGLLSSLGLGAAPDRKLRETIAVFDSKHEVRVLPELRSIAESDAAAWARRPEVRSVAPERELDVEVARLFARRAEIPMADLAPELLNLLTQRAREPAS